MKAVLVDRTPELRQIMAERQLEIPPDLAIFDGDPNPARLAALVEDAEILLMEHTPIPSDLLRRAKRLKGILFMGTGIGSYVDLALAQELGIATAITPNYGDRAVAEHAVALMFAAARKIAAMDRSIRSGGWAALGGTQLEGKRIAVVGLGGIGMAFAGIAQALGMEVVGWNRSPRDVAWFEPDLDRALEGADFVSLHLLLTPETRGLIDRRRLALPRPGYILVNTARADLVDGQGLLDGLRDGTIGHAALDVFPMEPPEADDPLVRLPNVTSTAHVAYMTTEAYVTLWRLTVERLAALRGQLAEP
jgi:D-3-phosphoglycerate dehydrogenase